MNFSSIPKESLLGKLLRLPLKLIPSSLTLPIFQGPMRGMRWIVGSGDHGYWLGSYELANQQLFTRIVRRGDVVLDIGAHVGYFTLLAARLVGPTGHVYAFEPLPHNAAYIERHIRINHLENVTYKQLAISDKSGRSYFGGGSSTSTGHLLNHGELEVQISSLDDLIKSGAIQPPQVMKIDVEGAELGVLDGGRGILLDEHPIILLATHGFEPHRRCVKLLQSMDYSLQPINAQELSEASEILALPH